MHRHVVVSVSTIQIDGLKQVVTEHPFTPIRNPPAHHLDHAISTHAGVSARNDRGRDTLRTNQVQSRHNV